MAYLETLRRLDGLGRFGVRLGLERVGAALDRLGDPHRRYASLHLAGTNGKGSTAAMIAACLRAAGIRTGLYTSPHLCRFTERIQIDGREIPRAAVVRLVDRVLGTAQGLTFFEVVTAAALTYFAEEGIEVAVVETGLGGRLDATNLVEPSVCVLTQIAIDHTEVLGGSLDRIAAEKAGIIKEGVPVVCAPCHDPRVLELVQRRCQALSAPLHLAGRAFQVQQAGEGRFSYRGLRQELGELPRPLAGQHQLENAGLCLAALEVLEQRLTLGLEPHHIARGLGDTRWPGRMEWIGHHLLDGAHNPAGCQALAAALEKEEVCLVMGVLGEEKDLGAMIEPLLPRCGRICFTRPDSPRAVEPARLARHAPGAEVAPGLHAALRRLEGESRPTLITGSIYLVGEARCLLLGEEADPWSTADPLPVRAARNPI